MMEILLTHNDEIALLKVIGAITADNVNIFQEKLDEILQGDSKKLEIDFSECNTINSIGIGKILTFYKDFTERKGSETHASSLREVEIIKCSTTIFDLFMTIKLNQLISISM